MSEWTDKELAEKVVALGVGAAEDAGDYWLDEWSYPLDCHELARNPCVAMALMERCAAVSICWTEGETWRCHARSTPGNNTSEDNDSLPRAIIEACVKALEPK